MFQGGFSGKDCEFLGYRSKDAKWTKIRSFQPQDTHSLQIFDIAERGELGVEIEKLKIHFSSSTDFYGRIIIYKLEVLGAIPYADQ